MLSEDEIGLDAVFGQYRAACPEIEPSAQFMPAIWQKIEARRSFWWVFQGFARTAMAGGAALAILLVVLNLVGVPQVGVQPSYSDALMADHSAEKTFYAEAIDNSHSLDH